MMVDEASDSNKALTLSFNWSVGARCLFFAGPSETSIKIFVSSDYLLVVDIFFCFIKV